MGLFDFLKSGVDKKDPNPGVDEKDKNPSVDGKDQSNSNELQSENDSSEPGGVFTGEDKEYYAIHLGIHDQVIEGVASSCNPEKIYNFGPKAIPAIVHAFKYSTKTGGGPGPKLTGMSEALIKFAKDGNKLAVRCLKELVAGNFTLPQGEDTRISCEIAKDFFGDAKTDLKDSTTDSQGLDKIDPEIRAQVWNEVGPGQISASDLSKIFNLGSKAVPAIIDIFLNPTENESGGEANQATLSVSLTSFARSGNEHALSFVKKIANGEIALTQGADGRNAYEIAKKYIGDSKTDSSDPSVTAHIEALRTMDVGKMAWQSIKEARKALIEIGEHAVLPLIKCLKDPNERLRERAAGVLGEIKDKRAIKPLLDVLENDNSFTMRHAVYGSISNFNDRRVLDHLKQKVPDLSNPIEKEDAMQAIKILEDRLKTSPLLDQE
ncbi:hypothetical protein LCGC14_1572180 [marine sediment metagenome]|uniref:HEAT repeat domain-containing protein n=1 Tax=marine sediment metagenome TaxID=412755 RepID=A0A0F9IJH9_9ZZZZ